MIVAFLLISEILSIYTGHPFNDPNYYFETGSDKIAPNLFCDNFASEAERQAWEGRYAHCLHKSGNSRIYGGVLTNTAESWPYLVLVKSYQNERDHSLGWYQQCGGTIIADEWILTAAHCFDGGTDYHVDIVLNENELEKTEEEEHTVTAVHVFRHPGYKEGFNSKVQFDFALVKVPPLNRSGSNGCFRPACLPKTHATDGKWCYIAGWGKTDNRR